MQETDPSMATLTIRNIDAAVKERLRVRAARHGRSMESEARSILTEAALQNEPVGEPNLAEAIRRRFAPLGGIDLELPAREPAPEPPKFEP
jgi:plasmid stability protein